MKEIIIDIVQGAEGASLHISNDTGFGYRVVGRKAWGNPYNKPVYTFKTDADEFIELINKYKYEVKE